MTVQLISFAFLVLLLMEFEIDFVFNRGLNSSINWFGEGKYSQLVGVILFNYAYSITVPAWLSEKTPDTKINPTIWTASFFSSFLYISFGMLAALAFDECSESMLTLLASTEVALITRVSAALFGLTIIGAGVPVFCVIIKNTLYTTRTFNAHWSFFIGSVFPYMTAWCLYKGTLLMDALNWAGLVVNGLAAFCFPLILSWWFFTGRSNTKSVNDHKLHSGLTEFTVMSKNYNSVEYGCEDGNFEEYEYEKEVAIESALHDVILPYRTGLIVGVLVLFASAISSSIIMDIVLGVGPS